MPKQDLIPLKTTAIKSYIKEYVSTLTEPPPNDYELDYLILNRLHRLDAKIKKKGFISSESVKGWANKYCSQRKEQSDGLLSLEDGLRRRTNE